MRLFFNPFSFCCSSEIKIIIVLAAQYCCEDLNEIMSVKHLGQCLTESEYSISIFYNYFAKVISRKIVSISTDAKVRSFEGGIGFNKKLKSSNTCYSFAYQFDNARTSSLSTFPGT